jgi:hypothetical protein
VPRSPQEQAASRAYADGWRAVNLLIRQGGSWSGRERDVFYRNLGGGRFEESSYAAGLDFASDGRAFAVTDFDHDGRLDLALALRTGPRAVLLHNEARTGHALTLQLAGRESNRDAIGAWVTLTTTRRKLHRFVRSGSGFLSQSSRRLHFGLAANEAVQAIDIEWPRGAAQHIANPPQQGLFTVVEGSAPVALRAKTTPTLPEPAPLATSLWLSQPVPAPESVRSRRLVSFHADWCPPCRAQQAEWNRTALAKVVAIESIDVDKTAMAEWNLIRRHLFEFREDLALPTSFLLDAQGRIVKIYRGVTPSATILADARATRKPDLPFAGSWILPRPQRNFTELATALAEHGLLTESQRYFALAQPDLESRLNYAALLLEQDQNEEGERLLRETVAKSPGNTVALMNLAVALLRRQKPAAEVLERLISIDATDAAAWELLGLARLRAGQSQPAIDAYEKARALGRNTSDVLTPLILLYESMGQADKARDVRSAMPR